MCIKRILCAVVCVLVSIGGAFAIDLQGTVSVSVTSDTATIAKDQAFNQARRQILTEALRQYTDAKSLQGVIADVKNSDLMNLVSASSIDSEQLSDTTYSANITMIFDADAVRAWLTENNVQNWLPDAASGDVFPVMVDMTHGIADWVGLQRVARGKKIDLNTKMLTSTGARLELPVSVRGTFTTALRDEGWRVENKDGVLRISK